MKSRTKAVGLRLTLSAFFLIGEFFAKCSAVQLRLNQYVKTGLRAKCRFLGFARKRQPSVTYNVLFWPF